MSIEAFDFDLPPDRIAHRPARPRESARLLHVATDGLHDRGVADLPDLLRPGDILVANDTRVIPAQLSARRGGARIGITLDQPRPDGTWHALARNARRLRVGDTLTFDGSDELTAEVRARDPDGGSTPSATRSRPRCDRPARWRCHLTSTVPPGRCPRTKTTIKPCSPTERAPSPPPLPGCILPLPFWIVWQRAV